MNGLLWNISSLEPTIEAPLMEYKSESTLLNVAWCNSANDWIGIMKKNSFNMLRVI